MTRRDLARLLFAWTLTITGVSVDPGPPPTRTVSFTVTDDSGAPVRTGTLTVPATMLPSVVRQSLQYQLQITKEPPPAPPASTPVTPGEVFQR